MLLHPETTISPRKEAPQSGPSALRASARPEARRGTTAVEFAVVAPLVFTLFLGTVEIGRLFMVTHLLTAAARAGARTGVVEGKSSQAIATAVNNFLTSVGITSDTITIKVNDVTWSTDANNTLSDVTINGTKEDASLATAGTEITVTVQVPVNKVTWVPNFFVPSGNLQGQFTMVRE